MGLQQCISTSPLFHQISFYRICMKLCLCACAYKCIHTCTRTFRNSTGTHGHAHEHTNTSIRKGTNNTHMTHEARFTSCWFETSWHKLHDLFSTLLWMPLSSCCAALRRLSLIAGRAGGASPRPNIPKRVGQQDQKSHTHPHCHCPLFLGAKIYDARHQHW